MTEDEEREEAGKQESEGEDAATPSRVRSAPTKRELEQMVGDLKDRVAGLEQQAKEQAELLEATTDRLLRALANERNARRRAVEERVLALALEKDKVLASFLPVLDHLRLAANSGAASEESMGEGLRLILRQMEDVLRLHGVTAFGAPGERFDPRRHEAVETVVAEGASPGQVVEVISLGYEREGRVLREARVKVASQPPPAERTESGNGEAAEA